MDQSDDISPTLYRGIVFAVLLYFVLLAYATITGDELATYVSEFVFGAIAIGVGTVLALQTGLGRWLFRAVVVCLVGGGILQFTSLFTRAPLPDLLASLAVFVGVGLYIYAVWNAD